MNPSVTGIVLAGGENKRFNGNEKAFVQINGQAIISRLIQTFHKLYDDIIVVTNSPVPFLDWDVRIVKDIYPMRSSLTGIHAGLFYMQTTHAFIAACDTPFLQLSLVKRILQAIQPEYDVVIPRTEAGYEPLCAAYSKRCLPFVQHQLNQNRLNMKCALFGAAKRNGGQSRRSSQRRLRDLPWNFRCVQPKRIRFTVP